MCGIFGIVCTDLSLSEFSKSRQIIKNLFLLSETRGKEASGIALQIDNEINIIKSPDIASLMMKRREYKSLLDRWNRKPVKMICIGHSRMVTNGTEFNNSNNQPVVASDITLVHNGIITNDENLWNNFSDKYPRKELDSELLPILLRENGFSTNLNYAVQKLFEGIEGMTSFASLFTDYDNLLLATNNGSIYTLKSKNGGFYIFASEALIIRKLMQRMSFEEQYYTVEQIEPGMMSVVSLNDATSETSSFSDSGSTRLLLSEGKAIFENSIDNTTIEILKDKTGSGEYLAKQNGFGKIFEERKQEINKLRRCTKCLLPESFPYIEFDDSGVCNFCRHYTPVITYTKNDLFMAVEQYRRKGNVPDSIITFSGGRDSSYCLHVVKKELKMNPIAYSYDWGMITDLGRRNQSRMCGKLGVEHILISADIRRKRQNIRANVNAWLKRPSLGTVPLFMAGDKQYFYYANQLMKEYQMDLVFFGENKYENTNFKSGFSGVKPNFSKKKIHALTSAEQAKMTLFYINEFLLNPSYINNSLFDTALAFFSYYKIPHNYLDIFKYTMWDEKEINETLLNEYNWETEKGYDSTWRIGDGTAAFYNYIYYVVAGFSENDTFRSNQIRQGVLDRDNALLYIEKENIARWDSIQWYCNTIGIDFEKAISTINKIPTLYL